MTKILDELERMKSEGFWEYKALEALPALIRVARAAEALKAFEAAPVCFTDWDAHVPLMYTAEKELLEALQQLRDREVGE
jgi:hypothetical protein